MIVEKDGFVYHDEHDVTVKISNDNTKHIKVVTVTLRKDLEGKDPIDMVRQCDELYREALGS